MFIFYRNLKLLLLLIVLLSTSGCATLFGKKSQQVAFESIPPGADVYIDDIRVGKTPIAVNLLLHVKKSNIQIYRQRSAKKKAKMLKDPEIKTKQDREIEDVALAFRNEYKIAMVKEGFKIVRFLISPKKIANSSPNKGLCRLDIVSSLVSFGIPLIVDIKNYACASFNSVYSYDLANSNPLYLSNASTVSDKGTQAGPSNPLVFGGSSASLFNTGVSR